MSDRIDIPLFPANHDHPHGHVQDGHDYKAENEKFFDKNAKEMDAREDVQDVAKRVGVALREAFPSLFNKESTTVMDYACGTGHVSRVLFPYLKSILGVDISQGVVDLYNARAAEQGVSENMKAVRAELKGDGSELDGAKFDVIVCSAAYHHFPDVQETTRILASFLKPGGSLIVLDFAKFPEASKVMDAHVHVVPNVHGFDESKMRELFEGAGLGDVSYKVSLHARLHEHDVEIFIARGVKPASAGL